MISLKDVLIIIGIVALGLFAVNQFLGFKYKAQFLMAPCDLCRELNPNLNKCFDYESQAIKTNEGVILYGEEAINYAKEKNFNLNQKYNVTIPEGIFKL